MFQERGVELLVDLLCESGSPGEVMQGEAAGVVAQLTSPCLQHGHHLAGLLQDLHRLLQALLRECLFVVHPTAAGSNYLARETPSQLFRAYQCKRTKV